MNEDVYVTVFFGPFCMGILQCEHVQSSWKKDGLDELKTKSKEREIWLPWLFHVNWNFWKKNCGFSQSVLSSQSGILSPVVCAYGWTKERGKVKDKAKLKFTFDASYR